MVGFDRVAALARDAGIKSARGTPSMPSALTMQRRSYGRRLQRVCQQGLHIDPWMLASVRSSTGDVVEDYSPTSHQFSIRAWRTLP